MAKRGFSGAIMRAYGARDHKATVTGTELISPGFLRVRMHSATLPAGRCRRPDRGGSVLVPRPRGP